MGDRSMTETQGPLLAALAKQTVVDHWVRHAAADEYERARRAAFIAVDEWIDESARGVIV